ncbi:MAG: hypothetical protein WBF17_15680 [Phycisphaerae bacterium]
MKTGVVCALLLAALPTATAVASVGDLKYVKPGTKDEAQLNCMRFSATKFSTVQPTKGNGLRRGDVLVGRFTAAGREVFVALDSRRADAEAPDVARLDLSGKGDFSRAVELPLKPVHDYPGQTVYDFGLTRIAQRRNGREVLAWAWGKYVRGRLGNYMYLNLFCALEGECTFGDRTLRVRFDDRTGNLEVTDAPDPAAEQSGHDLVWIGGGPRPEGAPFGLAVEVNGTWYAVEVTGERVSAKALSPKMGKVEVASGQWRCTLHGRRFKVDLRGGREPVSLPTDTYTVQFYQVLLDGKPRPQSITAMGRGRPIVVAPGDTTRLPVGHGAIRAEMKATVSGGVVTLGLTLWDDQGLRILKADSFRALPRIEVVNSSGTVVHKAKLEPG